MSQPILYMIAGPNGAGKTTAAMTLLPNFLSVHEFVNADKLDQAKKAGYMTCLIFLWLPDAEYAKRRVRQRVQEGGHSVPENVIERRYKRGLYNLVDLYLPLVDWAVIIDNTTSIAGTDSIIATKIDDFLNIDKRDLWRRVSQAAEESKHE